MTQSTIANKVGATSQIHQTILEWNARKTFKETSWCRPLPKVKTHRRNKWAFEAP